MIEDHFAWFGDGNTLAILRKEKYKDDDGVEKYKFIFVPSKRASQMYGFREGKELKLFGPHMVLFKAYKGVDIIPIIEEPGRSRYFIKCSVTGEETAVHHHIEDQRIELDSLQKSVRSLQTENSRLNNLIRMITGDQEQVAKYFVKIVKTYREMSKQLKEEGEGEKEQSE